MYKLVRVTVKAISITKTKQFRSSFPDPFRYRLLTELHASGIILGKNRCRLGSFPDVPPVAKTALFSLLL